MPTKAVPLPIVSMLQRNEKVTMRCSGLNNSWRLILMKEPLHIFYRSIRTAIIHQQKVKVLHRLCHDASQCLFNVFLRIVHADGNCYFSLHHSINHITSLIDRTLYAQSLMKVYTKHTIYANYLFHFILSRHIILSKISHTRKYHQYSPSVRDISNSSPNSSKEHNGWNRKKSNSKHENDHKLQDI